MEATDVAEPLLPAVFVAVVLPVELALAEPLAPELFASLSVVVVAFAWPVP